MRLILTVPALVLSGLALAAVPAAAATSHRLECPAVAPAEWAQPGARLSGVEVLATRAGQPIDDSAPPSLVPDMESFRAGTLHQRWQMNQYGDGWRFYVDCRYQGAERVLRLDAVQVKSCNQFISKFSRDKGESKRSERRLYCD
jgi:hypothetical protein